MKNVTINKSPNIALRVPMLSITFSDYSRKWKSLESTAVNERVCHRIFSRWNASRSCLFHQMRIWIRSYLFYPNRVRNASSYSAIYFTSPLKYDNVLISKKASSSPSMQRRDIFSRWVFLATHFAVSTLAQQQRLLN